MKAFVSIYLRAALASAFLVSVMGRVGSIRWAGFVDWVGQLTPYLPDSLTASAAVIATAAEVVLALALVIGYRTRQAALGAGVLLAVFALSMMFGEGGWRAPFWYSVFTASAGAFALARADTPGPGVDQLIMNRQGAVHPEGS